MDTLSHALWSKGVFGYRGGGKLAVFFGVFPDISFGALFSIKIISGTLDYSGGPTLENLKQLEPIPSWVLYMDNYTNSFVISFAVIGITYFIKSELIWPMFAWPFHIVLDFAFHTKDLFPIQLFWPISSFFIDGISWSHPQIWYPNFAGILILFLWRYKIIFK